MLTNIYYRMKLWSIEAKKEIDVGVNFQDIQKHLLNKLGKQDDEDKMSKRDKKLLKMLHESEIFLYTPEEKEPLLGLLKEIRYARNVFSQRK